MNHSRPPGLKLDQSGSIAQIILDRPEKRNAVSYHMWEHLPQMVAEIEGDNSINVLIMRGRGGTFSAGADISEFKTRRNDAKGARDYGERVEQAEQALIAMSKPSIAMVEGHCIGGGCEVALACDLRFADQTATFGITPARLGLVYSFSSTRQLVSVVGPAYAKYLLFSGVRVDAEEARRARLVDQVFDIGELEKKTLHFAQTIASLSQVSVRGAKTMIGKVAAGMTEPDMEAETLPLAAIHSPDYREGVQAYLEKRPPRFGTPS